MAKIWYGHFDSTPDDPRELLAEDWAGYISMFLSNGVRNGGTNLQITADGGGMYTLLNEGYANINGYFFKAQEDIAGGRYYKIPHIQANPTLPRIDRIVLRLDTSIAVRRITPEILMGEASATPKPPELTRDNNVYEISLAQVRVGADARVIKASDITDERLNAQVCGLINSLITADTEGMYQDFTDKFWERIDFYEASFESQMGNQEQQFIAQKTTIDNWYGSVKTDIARLQTFDFDNLASFSQVDKVTEFLENGDIEERIIKKLDEKLVAERKTEFKEDGGITVVSTVFDEDGTSILNKRTINTAFNEDGSIAEEVIE